MALQGYQNNQINNIEDALSAMLMGNDMIRKQGTHFMERCEKESTFCVNLFKTCVNILGQISSLNDKEHINIAMSGVVYLKNFIKKNWNQNKYNHHDDENDKENESNIININDNEKEFIKSEIMNIVTDCTIPSIQNMFCETIKIIADYDFPKSWDYLLNNIVQRLQDSYDKTMSVYGILSAVNEIMKRFRYVFSSDELLLEYKFVLDNFQEPLLAIFTHTLNKLKITHEKLEPYISQYGDNIYNNNDAIEILNELKYILKNLRLCCRIFYSLNWQDIPEFFEDNMKEWVEGFLLLLDYQCLPISKVAEDNEEVSIIEKLQTSIIENLSLYISKYEDEFKDFLLQSLKQIWDLVVRIGEKSYCDQLIVVGTKFITSVVSKQYHAAKIVSEIENIDNFLAQLIEHVVLPNLTIREDDIYTFEDDPIKYIQNDIEGSDIDTRRRVATDLIRGMCVNFNHQTTNLCMEMMNMLINKYNQNKNEWNIKDTVIHLMLAISVLGSTSSYGASTINENVDVVNFLTEHILPEIEDENINNNLIIKADSLKFITTFRSQFSFDNIQHFFPHLIRYLDSESNVVQTYASSCIEKFLTLKDSKLTNEHLNPYIETLYTKLFNIISPNNSSVNENEYIIKTILSITTICQNEIIIIADNIINTLTFIISQVSKNPKNAQFNHTIFELCALIITCLCENNIQYLETIEQMLIPILSYILENNIIEFEPYVFQIFSHLMKYHPNENDNNNNPLSNESKLFWNQIIKPLLSVEPWMNQGHIPALSRFLEVYLKKQPSYIISQNLLENIMGVFQKLFASRKTEAHAFRILKTVLYTYDLDILQNYIEQLFRMLLMRLQQNDKPRYIKLLILFFCQFCGKYEPNILFNIFESIQNNMLYEIINNIWLPACDEVLSLSSPFELKILIIGMSRILTEGLTYNNKYQTLIMPFINGINKLIFPNNDILESRKLLTDSDKSQHKISIKNDQNNNNMEFDSKYSRLRYCSYQYDDFFPSISSPQHYYGERLQQLCSNNNEIANNFSNILQQLN